MPWVAPGPFGAHITLQVECLGTGKIETASLHLKRAWIIGNHVLALDLAASFVRCFAPPPDDGTYARVADSLWRLRDPEFLLAAKNADPNESDELRCVHAFMGAPESAEVSTDFAHLSIGAVAREGDQVHYLDFDLQ